MNAIQIFNNPEFGQIRVVESNTEPVFCLIDICEVLELTPSKVSQRLDKGVLSKYPIQTAGGEQLANFVNEDGLYDIILDSRKPEARKFRKWITSEVLPSIRKSGGYMISTENDTPEMIMARALKIAQQTLDNHAQRVQILEGKTEIQEQEIQQLAPKAQYTDEVLQSTSTFTTRQIAQGLNMTPNSLNKKLKEAGIQYSQSGTWLLYAKYNDKGLSKIRVHTESNGLTQRSHQYMVWTEKGRKFIYDLLGKES